MQETVKLHFLVEKGNFKETIGALLRLLNQLYIEDGFVKCMVSVDTNQTDFQLYKNRKAGRTKNDESIEYHHKKKEYQPQVYSVHLLPSNKKHPEE